MKKRLLSTALAAALCFGSAAFAANTPTIKCADRVIYLNKPDGETVNGVFTVPVRRLCDALGASVDWYEKDQMIVINSKDNMTRLFLYIGNENLRIFTFTSVADGTAEEVKLEAPLKIVDGRTLVPFEQICKALKAEFSWSEDKQTVTIASDEVINDDKKVELSLKPDKEDVNAGDIVEISVTADNVDLYSDYYYSGYTAAVIYNPSEFEFVKSSFGSGNDENSASAIGADNANFTSDSVKVVYVTIDREAFEGSSGVAGKIQFKALSDNGGKFRLSDRISNVGYDTSIMFTNKEDIQKTLLLEKASEIKINTDEIEVK